MNVKPQAAEQPRAKVHPVDAVGIAEVPIDKIDVGVRVRPLDPVYAAWIGGEMKAHGQLQAIEIRPSGNFTRFTLTIGMHRLEGAKGIGWTKILARIVPCSDLEAELREIDENLVRFDLNALDRAASLAHRQVVYLKLHPETARGKAGAEARWHGNDTPSFASEAAARLRVSKRDIERAVRRHEKIDPEVRAKLAGTWIADAAGELDALTRLAPEQQSRAVKLMLQEAHPAASVAAAVKAISGEMDAVPDVDREQYKKLLAAWRRAGAKAKREFVAFLAAEGALDAPKVPA